MTVDQHNMSFPGPLGGKRRRMRSGGNVSTMSNNIPRQLSSGKEPSLPDDDIDEDVAEEKTAQTSKCKGATTIPIFLKKTYKMIETCDPTIASWTTEGDMFVVKDPEVFATEVIPQYFDHNKFSSFARQLNFYGFRKMQSKPIRNSDYDEGTAKHVTFYNENFKRGRCDLLKKIQRSTRGGGPNPVQDHQRDIQNLRDQVSTLEQKIADMEVQTEERVRRLELTMLERIEQVMLTVQQQQRTQLELQKVTSVGTVSSAPSGIQVHVPSSAQIWDPSSFSYPRGESIASLTMQSVNNVVANNNTFPRPAEPQMPAPPTLPPHPKQKQLPGMGLLLPGSVGGPPDRLNSLRGISQLSRGISGLTRGASVESSASAVLLKNSWEDKFFATLMLEGNDQGGAPVDSSMPTPTFPTENSTTQSVGPVTVSNRSIDLDGHNNEVSPDIDELSSVSSSEMV